MTLGKRSYCPKCNRLTTADQQHGIVRHTDESGDGKVHDGGCDSCCACTGARWVTVGDISPNRATVTGSYATEDIAYEHKQRGEAVVQSVAAIGERIVITERYRP